MKVSNDNETSQCQLHLPSGMTPRLDTGGGDGYASFRVKDPEGYDLQISGDIQPGDSLYKE